MVKQAHLAALALICLLLVVLVYVLNMRDSKHQSTHILLNPDAVNRIEIQSVPAQTLGSDESAQNPQSFVLQRDNETWYLKPNQPANDSISGEDFLVANQQRITPLLELLKLPRRQNYALAEINQQELGLDPPRASVKINSLLFHFGDTTADGNARYVLIDDVVHLYPELVYPMIRAGEEAFIGPRTQN